MSDADDAAEGARRAVAERERDEARAKLARLVKAAEEVTDGGCAFDTETKHGRVCKREASSARTCTCGRDEWDAALVAAKGEGT